MPDQISKPINKQDIEFYYGWAVRNFALGISGKTEADWENLSASSKIRYLNKASSVAHNFFNDPVVAKNLPLLSKNIAERF